MAQAERVTFYYPHAFEHVRLKGPAVDATPNHWQVKSVSRPRGWNVQTVLRLREAGYKVDLGMNLPQEGIVVMLPEPGRWRSFCEEYSHALHKDLLIVTIRADLVGFRTSIADAEIVQNPYFADEKRVFHVPHWTQPGLIPRDTSRPPEVQVVAFKGHWSNLDDNVVTPRLRRYFASRGIEFRVEDASDMYTAEPWHDYQDVDVVLAVREPWSIDKRCRDKPATKLMNAWLAGVPALLGPEYAFRARREGPLDYIEVHSDIDVIEALERFREDPTLYEAMARRALKRSREVTPEKTTERWAEVLFEKIPVLRDHLLVRASRPLPLNARRVWNWITMPPAPFEFYKQGGYVYRETRKRLSQMLDR